MQMTDNEIIRSYKEAPEGKKQKQIKILSELNACDKKTIREILRKGGFDIKEPKNRYTMAKEAAEAAEADGSERKQNVGTCQQDVGTKSEKSDSSNMSARKQPTEIVEEAGREGLKGFWEGYREAGEAYARHLESEQEDGLLKFEEPETASEMSARLLPYAPKEVIELARARAQEYIVAITEMESKRDELIKDITRSRKELVKITTWLQIVKPEEEEEDG